ncbi:alpha/beta hydrolase [Flavobacterium faecale]|uniref:Alpha/beta hydrolase n=1 Tax=Flavobacterium faecale TaxID=1355330 RepID=A0A2S1LDD6_9FLAO|nr:alpha/beta hydrolase [Flavobacterium faecale]AWG21717.1 alpha/beta hydrolase [Flavobacterium faecale]
MKMKLTVGLFLFTLLSFAQQEKLQWLDSNLSNYEYPFPVHFITLNIQQQELKMEYMDVKPNNYNGKNILLLHGKNFNGAYWKTTIDALTQKGFRVIVPDQIGFGKSSKPDNFQYTFQQLAQNTKQILDSLGIQKTAVLGHSMGGMVAARFALMFPEVTEKLILENPIGLEDWKLKVPYQSVDWWYKGELNQSYDKIKKYQLDSYYDGKWKPEYDQWVNLLAGWTLNSDFKKLAWNSALMYDMIFTQPVVYEFQNIKAPTLLIIGTRDRTALGKPLVSEDVRKTMGLYENLGKETQKKIIGSKLVEIPNIGHMPHIESFDKFINPLLDFLEK